MDYSSGIGPTIDLEAETRFVSDDLAQISCSGHFGRNHDLIH